LGPAFVAAVAYVDPGNFATNFAAGAGHGYLLVWVVVLASLMAMLVQYVASKAGLATGRSLPELCHGRFPRSVNLMLWAQAEAVAMATDLAEFVGAALGLHLVFGIGLFVAGIVTAVVAFGVLALQRRGYRWFERAILALLALIAGGFVVDLFAIGGQSGDRFARGLLPHLGSGNAPGLAVGIIGATVMPHVVYLHSALLSRRIATTGRDERQTLLRYNIGDVVVGLGIAGIVNVAMLCIAAAAFHRHGLSGVTNLINVHDHIARMIGGGTALAFAVALMASGLSSSSVGTFAGQVVMAGFTGWRIPLWLRRIVTMVPSLLVLALSVDTTAVLVLSQVVLAFGIPFALVPLILVTRDRAVMHDMTNRRVATALLVVVTTVIVALNADLVVTTIAG
jgi:manganese transport protein